MGAGPHREHVGERVRRRNASELVGVIDDGREEVDREHGRRRLIDFPHRRVVARLEPEKELFLVGQIDCRREAVQRIFEVARTPFRRSTALAGELRQRNFLLVAHGQSPFESNSVYQRRAGRRRPCIPPMPLRSFPPDVAGRGVVYLRAPPFRNWEGIVAGNLRASFLKVDERGEINPFSCQIQPVHKAGYSRIG